MCVPYSFVITKQGEIFSGLNLDHHTDICKQHSLEYDLVLKPEFQIWNREVKDLDLDPRERDILTKSNQFNHRFTDFYTDDGFLKNRFATKVQSHLDVKFRDWKRGLHYFENNWKIVKPYATRLVRNPGMLIDLNSDLRIWVTDQCERNIEPFVEVTSMVTQHETIRYELRFKHPNIIETAHNSFEVDRREIVYRIDEDAIDVRYLDFTNFNVPVPMPDIPKKQVSFPEIIKMRLHYGTRTIQDLVLKNLNSGVFRLIKDGEQFCEMEDVIFSDFKKVFERKEQRVECWTN